MLTEKLVESDQEKEQLKLEVRSANISLQDVQQRLQTFQVPSEYYHLTKLKRMLRKHAVTVVTKLPHNAYLSFCIIHIYAV